MKPVSDLLEQLVISLLASSTYYEMITTCSRHMSIFLKIFQDFNDFNFHSKLDLCLCAGKGEGAPPPMILESDFYILPNSVRKSRVRGGMRVKFSKNYFHGLCLLVITENFSTNHVIYNPSYWPSTI